MSFSTIAGVVGGVLLLLGNALFVVTEFAMTRVRQFDEEEFDDHPGLRRAWEMTDRLEIYLSGCQVGITLCSVGLGVVAEPALAALLEPAVRVVGLGTASLHAVAITVALIIINLLHVIVGEQAPTYLGIERTKSVARHLAPALYWWTWIMSPVIHLADRVAKGLLRLGGISITRSWTEGEAEGSETEDGEGGTREQRTLSRISALRGEVGRVLGRSALSRERRVEVLRALDIEQVPVREIMVPREAMIALDAGAPLEENLRRMRDHAFDRYPLTGASLDDVRGAVYTPTVFRGLEALRAGEKTLADVAVPPVTVPADLPVSELIDRFQEENQELALVTDADRTLGLITTTDAFEAIAGELEDPVDREQEAPPQRPAPVDR